MNGSDKEQFSKKKLFLIIGLAIAGFFVVAALMFPDGGETSATTILPPTTLLLPTGASDVRVEVYHFHMTRQCSSCIAIGRFLDETLNASFAEEIESGRLKSGHINIELPENREIVDRYGATGSSLYIGTYVNGVFYKEENTNVWYKLSSQLEYVAYLTPILERRLSGDLS
ncbi:MAG: nitrophenyl compound nitroreductase subunit ArsF family protein [Candidatus Altiarchaeota archaeon]|nr:nitrophenyl compound nitroreductase subunit ArsF family protein [Candidatus Altiarchaeota archaeon]